LKKTWLKTSRDIFLPAWICKIIPKCWRQRTPNNRYRLVGERDKDTKFNSVSKLCSNSPKLCVSKLRISVNDKPMYSVVKKKGFINGLQTYNFNEKCCLVNSNPCTTFRQRQCWVIVYWASCYHIIPFYIKFKIEILSLNIQPHHLSPFVSLGKFILSTLKSQICKLNSFLYSIGLVKATSVRWVSCKTIVIKTQSKICSQSLWNQPHRILHRLNNNPNHTWWHPLCWTCT
jgi:hypothetical protein